MNEGTSPRQMDSQGSACCASCGLMFGPETSPQLLPCLHALCVCCFAVSEKVTVCPVCQEKYDANEVISNLSLAEHHVNLREGNKCSSCDDPSISGWCVECRDNLCAVCVAAHKRAEDTHEHYVHTATPESPRPVMCPIHEQEVINSFCLMCDQLICRKCPPLHPHHLLQLSHQAVGRQRKQIRQMLQKVQQKSPSVQKSLNNLQGRLSDLEELQARLRLDVKNTVGRLCNMVLKKASKLLKEIEDVCRSEKEKIDERRTTLQRLKGKQDYVLTFTEKVLDSQDYTVLLSCKKQEGDDENGTPGTKIRDDKGGLVVLDSLGRDWLPRISLCRLSIRDYPSSCPPAFSVVRRKHSDGFPSGAVREDGQSVVPRCLSRPLLVKKQHCAACRISGKLIQCRVCRRAFHRECHLPLISLSKTDQWRCVLCRDLSRTGDWDLDPEPAASPCLSLYEQRKCEYLLLSLSCHKHSSALYRSATPSSPRYVDVTLVRGRLLGKLTPPYRTPAEFVSDLWLLLDTLRSSSKKALRVEHLQSFLSKQLRGVFGTGLHPSLLTDPYRGRRTEERRRRELKATQNKSDLTC